MGAKRFKLTLAVAITLLTTNYAYGAGNTNTENKKIEPVEIVRTPKVHDSRLEIKLFPRYDCTLPPPPEVHPPKDNQIINPFVVETVGALAVDLGIALVSDALSKNQDKLQATYTGIHTAKINEGIKCIEVLRKEITFVDENGTATEEDAMKMQILVKSLNIKEEVSGIEVDKTIAHRFALTNIANVNSATKKKVTKDRSEKHNFAISIGMIYVDKSGKETTLTRNLTLVENVPLVSKIESRINIPGSTPNSNLFAQLSRIQSTATFDSSAAKNNEPNPTPAQYESAVFKPLPNVLATTMTISITETDTRHKKASDVAELFENNKDSLESLLDGVFD